MNRYTIRVFILCLSLILQLYLAAQENSVLNTIDSVVRHIDLTPGKSYSFTSNESDYKWMNTVRTTKDGYTFIKRISKSVDRIVEQAFYARWNDLIFSTLSVTRIDGSKTSNRTGKFYFEKNSMLQPSPVGDEQILFDPLNPENNILRSFTNSRIAFQRFLNAVSLIE